MSWLESDSYGKALDIFTQYHTGHNAGLIDILVGMTAISPAVPQISC